ncbi:MAG: hypothetical protein KF760_12280 [Candidatus Eremiobacteraeota bacterium]|nr:hypothetical protein [Candidatus Eremiobacteraeota bacterium]MCW5870367.1 hypothetical protein [Candidatus Eremiobacteraeota bacterium]
MSILLENPLQQIQELASKHGVTYQPGPNDELAATFTRLTGDEVHMDENEFLILELRRRGHLTPLEALKLQAAYLHQSRPKP